MPLSESIIMRRRNTIMQLKWLRCSAGGVCFNVKSDSLHQQSWRLSLIENCSRWFLKSGLDCAEWPLLIRWLWTTEKIFGVFFIFDVLIFLPLSLIMSSLNLSISLSIYASSLNLSISLSISASVSLSACMFICLVVYLLFLTLT